MNSLRQRLRQLEGTKGEVLVVWRQVAADMAEGPDGQRVRLVPTSDGSGLDFVEEEEPAAGALHVLVRSFLHEPGRPAKAAKAATARSGRRCV